MLQRIEMYFFEKVKKSLQKVQGQISHPEIACKKYEAEVKLLPITGAI